MQNDPRSRPAARQDKPRLRLPFEKRKTDFVTWSYIHRVGLCITVAAFLLFGIAFVSCKLSMRSARVTTAIYMDFEQPEERERPRQEVPQVHSYDYSDVSNRTSNENAELDADLRDAQGTNASEIYDRAGKLDEQMRANREAFEDGINRINQMRNEPKPREDNTAHGRQDARVDGAVTVSYSFADPVRRGENIVVPAYMCEGGGTVVVDAVLDINGYVVSATVNRAGSTSDDCMRSTAVKAALGSRFNLDVKAPVKHRGTITYVFIPQ